ncbi:MAG: DUF333 domain-containing protein [Planctomycetota bacterium]|jgi:predicted outer membrane repeat protein
MKKWILPTVLLFVVTGVAGAIPNPSAVYCILQGYKYEIRTDEQGIKYGFCVFPDGSECGAWDYYCKCERNGIGCWPGNFSCDWPCKEMRCKEEGESVLVSKCCEGLDEIYPAHIFDANCNKLELVGWLFLCSDCGNDICDSWESRCNCPEDCAEPHIIYVDDDAAGNNDGSGWSDAFNDLQDALDFAIPGDEIRVAQGVYSPEVPLPPTMASNPNPANCARKVNVTADLSWTAGSDATSHDVYFGTTIPGMFQGNQSGTTFDPGTMAYSTTYFWRIDEVNNLGKTTTGTVWNFTTIGGGGPSPSPPPLGDSNVQDTEVCQAPRTGTFQLKNSVLIKGGYAGLGATDPNARDIELYETILSGDLNGDDVDVNDPRELLYEPSRSENSYHVVTGSVTDATAVLDGFTITGGNAYYGEEGGMNGGGMYNEDGSPTLCNCTFSYNSARLYGGGMANRNSSPVLTNCTFINNSAEYGGGIYSSKSSLTLTNCKFSGNSTNRGPGPPGSPMLTGYALSNDVASAGLSGRGGGISCSFSSAKLTNCTFTGNLARSGGGIRTFATSLIFNNCAFSGNLGEYGGGISQSNSSFTLSNCLFSGNSAEYGGGILFGDSSLTLTNCTFSDNSGGCGCAICNYSGENALILSNCILWNGGDEICNRNKGGFTIKVTYSNMWGGWPGESNIDADPCFVDLGYWDANGVWVDGDYRLSPDSPCIDAGDPNYVVDPNETDLDGKPRVIGDRIDMGTYEYGQLVPAEVHIVPRIINLASKGRLITAFLWLPEGYDATDIADIDSHSILLEYEIEPEQLWVDVKEQVVIARFSREDVQPILEVGDIELTISIHLTDGTVFEGTNVVKMIDIDKSDGKLAKLGEASNPNPTDGARRVAITADLSWTAGSDATSHDVYFGTINPPPFIHNQISTTFDPGTMSYGTTYYWRIDEVNKWGKTIGTVWNFTTIGPGPSLSPPPVGDSNEQAAPEVIYREAPWIPASAGMTVSEIAASLRSSQ